MKLIVYVLSALLLFSSVSAGDKQDVTTSDLLDDSHAQDALKYGINWIFEQAANKYDISDKNIDVTKVNSIKKSEDKGATYYSFDVEASNDDATITATFEVKCDDKGDFSVVNKWNYNIDKNDNNDHSDSYGTDAEIETETPDAGTNVEIDVEVDVETETETEIEEEVEEEEDNNKCAKGDQVDASEVDKDSKVKDALDFGLSVIFQKAADKYDISDKNIQVTQINCICKWEDNGNTYYSFDVEACNDNATITTTYNVKCDEDGNESVVNKWTYNIDKKDNENTDNHHTDEEEDSHDVEVDIEVTLEEEEEEEDHNKCENIDASQIDDASHLKDALVHGINWIFGKAHDKFDISTEDIVVTKINNLCGWKEDGNNYYSFDVEATNKDGDTVKTTFNVKCDSDGDLRVVNEWKYDVHYGDHKEEENNENCEDQGTDTYEDLENDVEVDVEVSVDKCQQGDEVDVSEIDNNSDLKDALAYGIGWIFQNAADKYGVTDDSVEVTKINNICKWEEKGKTYYYFDVEANTNNDASVNATFNVKCDDDGSLDVVNKWWYHIEWKSKAEDDKTEDKSDDCGSPQDQNTDDSYQNYGQDVEVTVEITIEDSDDNKTDSYNTDDNKNENYNN